MGQRNDSGIRKDRSRNRWVIDILWTDKDGRQHRYRRDAHVQTRDGASLEARELRDRALRFGTLEPKPVMQTFKQFVEDTFVPKVMPRFKKSTRVRYEALLRQGLLDHFGAVPLDQVADGVVGYAGELARRKVQAKGPCTFVSTILRAAVDAGILPVMPRIPRVWKEPKKLPGAPPLETVERLIGSTSRWIGLAIALAAYAGMRSGEVRALQARHVDLERGVIMIKQSFSEDEVDLPKSWQRVVPIAPPLRPALERAMRDKRPRDFMVTNSKGKTPTRQAILNRLVGLEQRLGIEHWTFHQMRHAFCTTLLIRGATVEEVRRLAGHTDLGSTARYVHATAAALKNAVDRLGDSADTGNQ